MSFRKALLGLKLFAFTSFVTLFLAACDSSRPQSTFGPEGPVADRQLSLFWIIFWIAVVVFIVVEGLLVYMVVRFRRRPDQTGLPPQTHGHTALELTWTIVPALIVVGIAIPTYITIADHAQPPEGDRVNVNVIAHQWWWEFEYPDLGVVTANELHIPIDKPIALTLLSQDVIHSFWVPKLAGKTDVVPNHANEMWLIAEKPNTYFGQCAELCGIAHAQMRFRVMSHTQEDFDAWVDGQRAPPHKPGSELAVAGRQLFGSKGCLACHTTSGPDPAGVQQSRMDGFLSGANIFPAPNLTSFGLRTTFAGGIEDSNTENLIEWVIDPEKVKPGNRMSQLAAAYQDGASKPTREEAQALVAYLQSLVPDTSGALIEPTASSLGATPTVSNEGGNADRGKQVFLSAGCTACHTIQGVPEAIGEVGPELTNVLAVAGTRVSGLSAEDYLRQSILEPGALVVEGFAPLMPAGLVAEGTSLDDLVAFLTEQG